MRYLTKLPRPGDHSDDVREFQEALNICSIGPRLDLDGHFGSKTRFAVSTLQRKIQLPPTGIPDWVFLDYLELSPDTEVAREVLANMIASIIQKDVDEKLRETAGKNRSPRIDKFNIRVGAPLGSPYCASGAWCAIDDACRLLGYRNPIPKTASSQEFRRLGFIPSRYIRTYGSPGRKGDAAIFQSLKDPSQGHYATVAQDQEVSTVFETLEYNTDGSGSRDGDGAYEMARSTSDKSSLSTGKIFVCFIDIPQWVLDFNVL